MGSRVREGWGKGQAVGRSQGTRKPCSKFQFQTAGKELPAGPDSLTFNNRRCACSNPFITHSPDHDTLLGSGVRDSRDLTHTLYTHVPAHGPQLWQGAEQVPRGLFQRRLAWGGPAPASRIPRAWASRIRAPLMCRLGRLLFLFFEIAGIHPALAYDSCKGFPFKGGPCDHFAAAC